MSGRPIVWIVAPSDHDFSQAESFGELQQLCSKQYTSPQVNEILAEVRKSAEISSPDDYLLITGPKMMNAIALAVFGFQHGRLNLLVHTSDRGYLLRKIQL
jgi:hypothetical protein